MLGKLSIGNKSMSQAQVNKAPKDSLVLAETFYSVQGEGPSIGVPAIFLRVAGCNLECEGFSYIHKDTKQHLGCDTKLVWKQGKRTTFEQLLQQWQAEGWLENLEAGAHLVLTGGEPSIQQQALMQFVALLDQRLSKSSYVEIETNATLKFLPEFLNRIDQINASPKLSFAEKSTKAFNPEVIQQLVTSNKAYFKFVVATEADVEEVETRFIADFHIPRDRVLLMPEGGNRTIYEKNRLRLVEICKAKTLRLGLRAHIDIWNEVTGV
jgi:6-pyruvoyltetrahydropterin 2'-reductase